MRVAAGKPLHSRARRELEQRLQKSSQEHVETNLELKYFTSGIHRRKPVWDSDDRSSPKLLAAVNDLTVEKMIGFQSPQAHVLLASGL
jgi:hypothetical protein